MLSRIVNLYDYGGPMASMIQDIIYGRRQDAVTLPVRCFLRILAMVYGAGVQIRNLLYETGVLKARHVPCRVVCIGNITAGGTGKTPVTVMTARLLMDRGVKTSVVSRGYKRKGKASLVVSEGDGPLVSPEDAGDEPHILASLLPGVPVVVGSDRHAAAMFAYDRFKPDIIICDDAFQHRRLYRDIDIVAAPADNPIGSEYLLPRGLLRESPYGLKRAKAVVVTRMEASHDRERISRMVRFYAREPELFWCQIKISGLREPGKTELLDISAISGKKITALSNNADPSSFYKMLEERGADIVLKKQFNDHHRYTPDEIDSVMNQAVQAGAELIIMTAKDERNLPDTSPVKEIPLLVLDITAELIENEDGFVKMIFPNI